MSVDPIYQVYGARLASRHTFTYPLPLATTSHDEPADLIFEAVASAPLPHGWEDAAPLYDAHTPGFASERVDSVLMHGACVVLRFHGIADFFVWEDCIQAHLLDPVYEFALELLLLGTVLTVWLERHGLPTLHAASVDVEGRAVGFLATNKGGKSSLAATFVRHGAALMGDDLLPLERRGDGFVGRAGYPQMRFWPEHAERLLGGGPYERVQPGSPKVRVPVGRGFGRFSIEPRPLAVLYLPERVEDGRVRIESLGYGEALTELVRHSFLAGVLETLGLAPTRFAAFAQLLRQVPVRRLRYPSGIERLEEVHAAVLDDLGMVHSALR